MKTTTTTSKNVMLHVGNKIINLSKVTLIEFKESQNGLVVEITLEAKLYFVFTDNEAKMLHWYFTDFNDNYENLDEIYRDNYIEY